MSRAVDPEPRWWKSLLCFVIGHAEVTDFDGKPLTQWTATSGRCSRCGYVGMVNEETGRFFGLFR